MFSIGDEVVSLANPDRRGTIVGMGPMHAGIQYYIVNFGGNDRTTVPELDLRLDIFAPEPVDNLKNGNLGGYHEFQRIITYFQLQREYPLRNNIYAFNASRTRFYPFQFKPLIKFLDSPNHRLLIADEVGLGKTIEAGLILTELRARQNVSRVLVICPSNLTAKWYIELKKRFGEDFKILKVADFLEFLKEYQENPERTIINGIISLEAIRKNNVLDRLQELTPSFDLVIIDEAHHMRNFGKNQRRAGVLLSQGGGAMLLLTATPIHLGNENLFSLLNILDEDEFPDLNIINDRLQKNESIVKSQICIGQIPPKVKEAKNFLLNTKAYPWIIQNPVFNEAVLKFEKMEALQNNGHDFRKLQLELQRDLAELNLIGHIFTRTRKREVQVNVAKRKAFSIRLELTPIEKQFYDAVTNYIRELNLIRTDIMLNQKWLLNTPQRRMASCIPAMVEYYKNHVSFSTSDRPEDFVLTEERDIELNESRLEEARHNLLNIIKNWPKNSIDTKYNNFLNMLLELRKNDGFLKVIVFAFFKDTLKYLKDRLLKDNIKSVLISGDVKTDDRVQLIEKFRTNSDIEVMLSSRVGSEGLDFQFCNTLFNYDLPWNPMEVEQRIGRLDRIGQEFKVIRIYNFWIRDTIEQRILERLYDRIKIFEHSIGELESILGDEIRDLEIYILSNQLTPQEEEIHIQQIAAAIERRLKDLQELENSSAKFIGTDYYFEEEIKMIDSHRRYITKKQLYSFIKDFIINICPATRFNYDFNKDIGEIYPDQLFREFITEYGLTRELFNFTNAGTQGVSITFDSQVAYDNNYIEFITVLHPLIQSILKKYKQEKRPLSNAHHIVLKVTSLKLGFYFFFIFRLRITAIRGTNVIEMIVLDENLEEKCVADAAEMLLVDMIEKGEDFVGEPLVINPVIAEKAYNESNNIFLKRVSKIRDQLNQTNNAFLERRLGSLKAFYEKNISNKRELLSRGESEGRQEQYLRMLRGVIKRLESELEEKTKTLEKQRTIMVNYDEISAGILEVLE